MFNFMENPIVSKIVVGLGLVTLGAATAQAIELVTQANYTPKEKMILEAFKSYLERRWEYFKVIHKEEEYEKLVEIWSVDVFNVVSSAKAGNPELCEELDEIYQTVKKSLI